MSASIEQIKALFETNGLSPEQIAEIEQLNVMAVKALLLQNSAKYRELSKEKPELDFNESDEQLAIKTIRRIAEFSEEDGIALKAAMFMRNDRKGRLDVKKGMGRLKLQVNVLNEHVAKALAAITPSAPKELNDKPIEV